MASTRKHILVYLAFAFGIAWLLWFLLVYPRVYSGAGSSTAMVQLLVTLGMFAPALAVLATRLITHEGFSNTWIAPRDFRHTWKYYVLGWFGPLLLIAAGAALYFVVFPQDFDPSMSAIIESTRQTVAATGETAMLDDESIRASLLLSAVLVPLAPALNFVACFGEEWGWRGYLLPKLLSRHSVAFALVVSGVIWGLWHAPIIVLGHNYGLGYVGYPVAGIAAMCVFTVVLGVFLGYVALRSGSCLPAVFAHGMVNGSASLGLMFSATGGNPFVGPMPTGIIGAAFFILAGAFMLFSMVKRERLHPALGMDHCEVQFGPSGKGRA